jgi:hypothetical protein
MTRSTRRASLAGILGLLVGACQGTTDPNGSGSGSVQLNLSQTGGASLLAASLAPLGGNVGLDAVGSVEVTLTRVEALPQGAVNGADGAWVVIELGAPVTLDLMDLPTAAEDAIKLPKGELAAGTYFNLRLFVSDATITFSEDVTVGGGPAEVTYVADTPYPLRIASPLDTRLLVPTGTFVVTEGESTEIDLIFDLGASVRSIVATPLFLLMTPVIIATVDDD